MWVLGPPGNLGLIGVMGDHSLPIRPLHTRTSPLCLLQYTGGKKPATTTSFYQHPHMKNKSLKKTHLK